MDVLNDRYVVYVNCTCICAQFVNNADPERERKSKKECLCVNVREYVCMCVSMCVARMLTQAGSEYATKESVCGISGNNLQ